MELESGKGSAPNNNNNSNNSRCQQHTRVSLLQIRFSFPLQFVPSFFSSSLPVTHRFKLPFQFILPSFPRSSFPALSSFLSPEWGRRWSFQSTAQGSLGRRWLRGQSHPPNTRRNRLPRRCHGKTPRSRLPGWIDVDLIGRMVGWWLVWVGWFDMVGLVWFGWYG